MVEDITPAKRHGQRLLSGGATAVDGADGENVGEGRGNGCLKRLRFSEEVQKRKVLRDVFLIRTCSLSCFRICSWSVSH